MLAGGVALTVVAENLGHANTTTLQQLYAHATEERALQINLLEGAPDRNRTYDTFFRREVLYPLSYRGAGPESGPCDSSARTP